MGSSMKELIEPATLAPDTVRFLQLGIKGGVSVSTLDRRPQPSLARAYSLFSQFYRAPHPAPPNRNPSTPLAENGWRGREFTSRFMQIHFCVREIYTAPRPSIVPRKFSRVTPRDIITKLGCHGRAKRSCFRNFPRFRPSSPPAPPRYNIGMFSRWPSSLEGERCNINQSCRRDGPVN